MQFLFMALFAGAVVAADQLFKAWVVSAISPEGRIPVIDGLFHLTYTQNDGALFSILEGMQWLFIAIFLLLTVAIVWEFSKKRLPFKPLERWLIVAVYAGGIGNTIDRLRLGYVVDMIEVEFITFPVFNIADCFISCGCVLLLLHLCFFNKAFWKEDKKK